ncbi:MAG: hypothetical protein DRQ88_07130 [Epsilonproteobacteria bacterium]|nr:MAG: hypothetical protein DRQ89_03285 [Campylobacterota bacterium]RLA66255.1 MAG: hypothetical protein DRQ88_07130 [Campylobacterota bacterium]
MGPINLFGEDNEVPGLFSSLQNLIKFHKKGFNQQYRKLKAAALPFALNKAKDIRLDPYFVRSLIFYSDNNYLSLLKSNNLCDLYALIENNLLRTSKGIIKNLAVVVKSPDNQLYSTLLKKNVFLNYVYGKKCINKKELSILFNQKNFNTTFKDINLRVPKSYKGCINIFNSRVKNPNTAYLCKIPMAIKVGKAAEKSLTKLNEQSDPIQMMYSRRVLTKNYYLKNITLFKRNYLENLCHNLTNAEKFCSFFQADDAWSKVISGENPNYKMSYKCRNYLNIKGPLPTKVLKKCAQVFKETPDTCITRGNAGHPSIFPLQSCDDLSKSLNKSKMITKYHDCPGIIENQSITNIYRIIKHYDPSKKEEIFNGDCASKINLEFANLFLKTKNKNDWPLKICYQDLAKEEEICTPYIPGNGGKAELSEGRVMAKILERNKGAPPGDTCKVVDTKSYNPVKLEYRLGCFIVYNQGDCSSLHCPKKIIYKRKEVKGIRYDGRPNFDYFPNSSTNTSGALVNILKYDKKYRFRELRSLSEIVQFFSTKKKVLAHGVGCAGDILPNYFTKRSFNECRPLPFIIDGYIKDKRKKIFLITRTAIDDVHTPRLINWNYIYSGVKNYGEVHPMKSWLLYGINK